jgi:hypothetical protein
LDANTRFRNTFKRRSWGLLKIQKKNPPDCGGFSRSRRETLFLPDYHSALASKRPLGKILGISGIDPGPRTVEDVVFAE